GGNRETQLSAPRVPGRRCREPPDRGEVRLRDFVRRDWISKRRPAQFRKSASCLSPFDADSDHVFPFPVGAGIAGRRKRWLEGKTTAAELAHAERYRKPSRPD